MSDNPTRKQIEDLIEILAPYKIRRDGSKESMPLKHGRACNQASKLGKGVECFDLWCECSLEMSFQTIIEEGWEKECMRCGGVVKEGGCQVWGKKYGRHRYWEVLKPEAKALATFLLDIFTKEK